MNQIPLKIVELNRFGFMLNREIYEISNWRYMSHKS